MNARRSLFAAWLAAVALTACRESAAPRVVAAASLRKEGPEEDNSSEPVATIDHWVPHISTVVSSRRGQRQVSK